MSSLVSSKAVFSFVSIFSDIRPHGSDKLMKCLQTVSVPNGLGSDGF